VALILREATETPGRTAALVSPDRLLARRVAVRLASWGIRIDDSAGRPLAKTPPGAFLDLVVETVSQDFVPATVMALLKHPLTRLGLDPFAVRRAARTLEIAAFRTPYIGRGIAGIRASLRRTIESRLTGEPTSRAVRRLWDEDIAAAERLVDMLEVALAPLASLFTGHAVARQATLTKLAAAHLESAEAVAQLPLEADGTEPPSELWKGDAGEMASSVLRGLIDETMPPLALAPADYADVYRSLISTESVRPRVPLHPRLFIWGPLEARLQQTDVVILGSLNDGTWPEAADPGPWLNRPMRADLGLPSPEERIGHAAHDFASQLGAERVYLTRSLKVDGVPTVASRWLLRLGALLDSLKLRGRLAPTEPWLGWALDRDAAPKAPPILPPAPKPPLALRPRRMSVSGVETWIANPYAIFARHILGLEPMPPLGAAPDASVRGAIVHTALSRFAQLHPTRLPLDSGAELMRLAADILVDFTGNARIAAFWLPRFERFAHWFGAREEALRAGADRVVTEITGKLAIDAPGGPFLLTARADRIDQGPAGLVITDYKTGLIPPDKRVLEGTAPQLALEAAIALAGGFPDIAVTSVAAIRYIAATGGEPPGADKVVKCPDVAALAADTRGGLERLIAQFDQPQTPYAAVRRAGFRYDFDDYAHLARVAEWSGASAEEA
jgi:ATP-dependent helicase/nuclease subunit B